MSSTEVSKGTVHALPVGRQVPEAEPDLLSPKQQMLDSVDVLRARIEAGFITGFQVYAGTRLGEPVEDLVAGTFANSPIDSALMVSHSLYRRLYALKEAELSRLAPPPPPLRHGNAA